MTDTLTDQGWAFPGTSRKAHYFRKDKLALCGKWSSLGIPAQFFEQETIPSKDDCVACRRRLDNDGVR